MNMKFLHPLLLALLPCSFAPAAVTVLDDADPAVVIAGSWTVQPSANRVGGSWRYQNAPESTADTATYNFTGLAGGKYVISRSTWSQGNTSAATSYAVSDGGGTWVQNTQGGLTHFDTAPGATNFPYQRLSGFNGYTPFTVADGTVSVLVSDTDAANFLGADAIRLESVRADVQKIYVIGNGDAGYSETGGTWAAFNEAGDHGANFRYSTGTVNDLVTVSFTGIDPGTYRISTAWTASVNRSTNVTLSYSAGASTDSITYSQEPGAAANDVFENVNWQDMFSNVTVAGSSLTLTLRNNVSGGGDLLIADAFRLELVNVPEPGALLLGGLGMLAAVARRRRLA